VAGAEDDFVAMRQAFQAGDAIRVALYAQRLQGHVLEPYAAYYQLRPQLENTIAGADAVKKFLFRYQDTPLADRLRGEWLKTLGKTQQWELFAEAYPALINRDTELTCYSFEQRLAASDLSAHNEARRLWFSARDLPESCKPVFDMLVSAQVLTV
jgi:soluble lytic murein transglycosylase